MRLAQHRGHSMQPRLSKRAITAACAALLSVSAVGSASAEPALWRIKKGDSTVYLFGSVHVLPSDINWRGPNVDKAIKASNVFVWESPGSVNSIDKDHRFIMDNGVLPRGKMLSKMLSPAGLKDYKEVLKRTGAEPELVNVSHPWRAWFLLEQGGLRPKPGEAGEDYSDVSVFKGVDLLLQQEADKRNKEAEDDPEKAKTEKRYLDGKEALAYFEKSLPDDHIQDFEKHLHKLLTERFKFRPLVNEWQRGNVAYIAKQNADEEKEFPLDQEMILHERNKNWIPQIEKMLTEKKTFFVTVGAAHLAGKGSVIDLLCANNWKIERLNGPGGSGCTGFGPTADAGSKSGGKTQEVASAGNVLRPDKRQ
jgi:uncharacterized protein